VVTAAHGPELHRGDADAQKRDDVGRSIAAHDAPDLAVGVRSRRGAKGLHVGGVRVDQDRRARKGRDHARAGELANLVEDRGRVLLRQIAHVHVNEADVGDLVQGIAAKDSAEVYRRSVEQLRASAGER